MRKLRIFSLKETVLRSLADFLRRAADRIVNQLDASDALSKSLDNKVDFDSNDGCDRVSRDEIYNDNSSDLPPAHWIELVRLRAPGLLRSMHEATPYSPKVPFPGNQNRTSHQQPPSNTGVEPEQSGDSSENDKELQNELSVQRDPTTEPVASDLIAPGHDSVQNNKICQSIGTNDEGLCGSETDSPTNRTQNFNSNLNCSPVQPSPMVEVEESLENQRGSNASGLLDTDAGVNKAGHSPIFIGSQPQEKPEGHRDRDPRTVLDSPQDTVIKSESDRVSHSMRLNNRVNEPQKPMKESRDRGGFLDLDTASRVDVSEVKKNEIDRVIKVAEGTGSVKSRKRGFTPSVSTTLKPIRTIQGSTSANLKAKKTLDNHEKTHDASMDSHPVLKTAPNFRMNNQNQPDRLIWPDLPGVPLFHNKQMTGRWPELPEDAWDELENLSLKSGGVNYTIETRMSEPT